MRKLYEHRKRAIHFDTVQYGHPLTTINTVADTGTVHCTYVPKFDKPYVSLCVSYTSTSSLGNHTITIKYFYEFRYPAFELDIY